MATQYVYPIGTSGVAPYTTYVGGGAMPNGFEWDPSSGGNNHHLLVDENPANETDYIRVSGFGAGKIARLVLDPGPVNTVVSVTGIQIEIHLRSTNVGNSPALRVRCFMGGSRIYQTVFLFDTGGVWEDVTITLPAQSIAGNTWYAGPIEIELLPLNGDLGYSPSL